MAILGESHRFSLKEGRFLHQIAAPGSGSDLPTAERNFAASPGIAEAKYCLATGDAGRASSGGRI